MRARLTNSLLESGRIPYTTTSWRPAGNLISMSGARRIVSWRPRTLPPGLSRRLDGHCRSIRFALAYREWPGRRERRVWVAVPADDRSATDSGSIDAW